MRTNILDYSGRLDALSQSLLSLPPFLNRLPEKDLLVVEQVLGNCYHFLGTFRGLQDLLELCSINSKLKPMYCFMDNA